MRYKQLCNMICLTQQLLFDTLMLRLYMTSIIINKYLGKLSSLPVSIVVWYHIGLAPDG